MFRRYLLVLALVVLGGLLLAGGFNWFMNPFGVYGGPRIDGVNNVQSALDTNARMAKPLIASRYSPTGLILGSSAAEVGLNPAHKNWKANSVFNLAMSGGNMLEARRYFDHLVEMQTIEQVVLQFDFLMAHGTNSTDEVSFVWSGMRHDPMTLLHRTFQTLFSSYALWSSFDSFERSKDSIARDDDSSFLENGQRGWRYYEYRMGRGVEYQFDATEREYATRTLFSGGAFRFSYPSGTKEARSPFDHLRAVVRRSHEMGVDLRIILPASHARYLVLLRETGLWPAVEAYKTTVVQILHEEAQRAGATPFKVWDFFRISGINVEPVPQGVDGRMQFFWDPIHFKNDLGDLMLGQVLSGEDIGYGVPLTTSNIYDHLVSQRAALDRFTSEKQDALSVLHAMLSETAGERNSVDLTVP